MPINYYSVQNDLESQGWKLISTSYKNLNTELEMKCPEGHQQFQTYAYWRKHHICEFCMAGDPYKVKKNKVPAKNADTMRILALDAATNITGYSIYDNGTLVTYGTYHAKPSSMAEERINDVKKWLEAAIEEWQPDVLGIENIQLQRFGPNALQTQVKTFQVLANLQGVLLDVAFEKSIDHELAYAAEWRSYCGINSGNQERANKKAMAKAKVKLWYDLNCTEDEADAICLGKYFAHKFKNNVSTWGEDID